MIVEDNFFPATAECPPNITVAEICERFTAAGLACRAERYRDEIRVTFEGRKSNLVFTVNASGCPLTASMLEESDYDVNFACALFDVFDSIGWTYAPSSD